MSTPFLNSPALTAGEPNLPTEAPTATGGRVQPKSPRGPKLKTIKVKAHTRTVKAPPKTNGGTPAPTAPPVDPNKALLDAAVRLHFGGQEQALKQQLQSNGRFANLSPGWYQQAINEIKGIQGTQSAQNAQTLAGIQHYNSPVAVTGSPDAQQAADARNNLNSQYAAMFGRDSQANSDLMGRMQAGMQQQGLNTQIQANRDRGTLLSQQGQLAAQKGDFRITTQANMDAAAQKQQNAQDKNNLIAQGLGIKNDTLQNVTKPLATSLMGDRRAANRTARIKLRNDQMNNDRQYNLDVKKFGADQAKTIWQQQHPKASDQKAAADLKYFQIHGYYPPTGPPKNAKGSPSSFTDTQIRASKKSFRQAADAVKEGGFKKGDGVTADAYLKVKGIKDPLLRKAAILSKFYGGVDKATQHAVLVNYGITLALRETGRGQGGPNGTGRP